MFLVLYWRFTMKVDLSAIATEKQNVNTMNIDQLSTHELVKLINKEDQAVIDAVGEDRKSVV